MKCPICDAKDNYKMESRLDGNTTCSVCGSVAPTKRWKQERRTVKEKMLLDALLGLIDFIEIDNLPINDDALRIARMALKAAGQK